MKLSTVGLDHQTQEGVEKRCLNSELWHACAGPLVSLPTVGTRVVYFPQGHSEQVAVSTNREVEGHIPNYPNLPPQLICQLHDVTMHADVETDEVYAQMTLQPLSPQEQKDIYLPAEMVLQSKQPTNYFCKTLTASDTSTHGGFSVPRRAAEKVFPPLDYTQQPPAQELIARDLHDVEWKFRHIFRGNGLLAEHGSVGTSLLDGLGMFSPGSNVEGLGSNASCELCPAMMAETLKKRRKKDNDVIVEMKVSS